MSERPQSPSYPLRMSQELRERLKRAADKEHRSLNAEIVARLESTFAEEDRYLEMDFSEYAEEIIASTDAEAIAAQTPELTRRLATVESQLQQVLELLQKK